MKCRAEYKFSGLISVFQESRLPELARPVGYAALIDAFELGGAVAADAVCDRLQTQGL